MTGFVSSRDVPSWLAEPVARVAHERSCSSFDGRSRVRAPKFEGDHAERDLLWASIHVSDLCNAFGITPDDLAWLMDGP